MIPIKYRLDSAAEKEYIEKALSCIKNENDYSEKLENLLKEMKQKGCSVADEILKKAERFRTDYPKCLYLCEWLVMSYENMEEIKQYLHNVISTDLREINADIKEKGYNIEFNSYHDLKKNINNNPDVKRIVPKKIKYDKIYDGFKKFNLFYNNWSRKKINYWITEKTELKVCPYCNISYTYNRGKTVTAQLDHFFPKS